MQPRVFDNSEASKMPPVTRELWFYLLRNVNFSDNGKIKRGQGFFRFEDIQNALAWYVGYRKMMYSKPQLTKSLRRLCEGNMVETAKETRGIMVTICNFDHFQDPKNYEGNGEGITKKSRRKNGGNTILEERVQEREERKELKHNMSDAPQSDDESKTISFSEEEKKAARFLAEIILTRKKIKIPPAKLNGWCMSIRQMNKTDGIDHQRIMRALVWYKAHIGEEYVVVIESGKSLREKFLRLESAMQKETVGFVVSHEESEKNLEAIEAAKRWKPPTNTLR